MSASLSGHRDLPVSQYNLNSYWGRVRQSAEISDPRWGDYRGHLTTCWCGRYTALISLCPPDLLLTGVLPERCLYLQLVWKMPRSLCRCTSRGRSKKWRQSYGMRRRWSTRRCILVSHSTKCLNAIATDHVQILENQCSSLFACPALSSRTLLSQPVCSHQDCRYTIPTTSCTLLTPSWRSLDNRHTSLASNKPVPQCCYQ